MNRGEIWSQSSENVGEKVVLMGSETAKRLFGTLDPVGRNVRIGRFYFRIIGVLEEKGQSPFGKSQDEIVVMPITTMGGTVIRTRPNEAHMIMFSATSAETQKQAKRQAELILRARHRIPEGQDDDYQVFSQKRVPAAAGHHLLAT